MSLYNFDAPEQDKTAPRPPAPIQDGRPYKPNDKFRIAVCLSGQPRHWRTALPNIKQFFDFAGITHPEMAVPVEVDYFIHTWDINTWRKPKTNWSVFDDVAHGEIAAIVAAYEPRAHCMDSFDKDQFKRAWDPMFYSHARSLMLKRDYEISNDFQYDLVIKARLDVVYDPQHRFPLQRVWPLVAYTCTPISKFPNEFNYNSFDDVMFYGDSATMDLMGDLYSTYQTLHSLELIEQQNSSMDLQPDMWYGPGCLLYEHLTNLGIHPEGNRVTEYAVVRSTAVSEKLDGITDYEKIRKKWFEWYI